MQLLFMVWSADWFNYPAMCWDTRWSRPEPATSLFLRGGGRAAYLAGAAESPTMGSLLARFIIEIIYAAGSAFTLEMRAMTDTCLFT